MKRRERVTGFALTFATRMPHFVRASASIARMCIATGDLMTEQLVIGFGLVILAGLLNGSFAAPMKRMPAWRWENSWLIFAVTGLIIFPWIITLATVPQVGDVYSGAISATLWKVVLFGIAWGVGSTLFGIGISPRRYGSRVCDHSRNYGLVWIALPARGAASRGTAFQAR